MLGIGPARVRELIDAGRLIGIESTTQKTRRVTLPSIWKLLGVSDDAIGRLIAHAWEMDLARDFGRAVVQRRSYSFPPIPGVPVNWPPRECDKPQDFYEPFIRDDEARQQWRASIERIRRKAEHW